LPEGQLNSEAKRRLLLSYVTPGQRGAPARDPAALGAQTHRRITSSFSKAARWLQSPLLQVSALGHSPTQAKIWLNTSPCNPHKTPPI